MVARIEWGPIEAVTSVANEARKARNFIVESHDGFVKGQIVVTDDSDSAVTM